MTKKNQSKSNLYNCLIVKSQQLNQLYNSSLIDFSLTFNVGFNALIYSASLIFLFTLLLLLLLRILKSLQLALGQRLKYTTFCLCSNLVLPLTGNWVESFVPWYVIHVLTFDGILFFSCFFILDNNWMPCFPENGRNNCSFVSLLSVVLVCGSLVISTFSFSSSFLIMFSTVLDG